MKYYAERFADARLIKVEHSGHAYGGTPAFASDEWVQSVSSLTGTPLIVSRFEKADGQPAVVIVNLSQKMPTHVTLTLGNKYGTDAATEFWLAPGQLSWFDLTERKESKEGGGRT